MSKINNQEEFDIVIAFCKNGMNLEYNKTQDFWANKIPTEQFMRYLKGIFTNRNRFYHRFAKDFIEVPKAHLIELEADGYLKEFEYYKGPDQWDMVDVVDRWMEIYDEVEPFNYAEAFRLKDDNFRRLVFTSIGPAEMIKELGYTRLSTEGREVTHKKFNSEGEFLGTETYHTTFEMLEVNAEKIAETDKINMYAVRCWCTSTDEEHILWVEDIYKNSPLEAIASTCRVPKNLKEDIKEIKRQGDIFLLEFNDSVDKEKLKNPSKDVPLSADEYFSLLTAQS